MHGPARSPTVLDTFSPDSAKADAHWLIACSDAPAHTMRRANIQNSLPESSSFTDMLSPPSFRERTGTRQKYTAFSRGTNAHIKLRILQLCTPAKNRVEIRITPTCPQQ